MQKEIDLLSFLSRVTEKITKHYRSDFLYDSRKLQEAAQAAAPEERRFFWMSRPSGTWCVLEREVFIRGSSAHNIWTYYADEPEGIVAYRVNVIEEKDGIVVGTVHPLNYREQVRRVLTHAIPATLVTLRYESGLTVTVPFADYPRNLPIIRPQNGGIQSVRFEVQDEAALEAALSVERQAEQKQVTKKHCSPTR